jgi:hypothetical protein
MISVGRRCSSLVLALLVVVFISDQAGGDTLRIGHWEQTTYYRHIFDVEEAVEAVLQITAVGDYTLYVNGVETATDPNWRTAEEAPISLASGSNDIAIVVTSSVAEAGNGLLVSLQGGSLVVRSTFTDETSLWYWSGDEQVGTAWTTANVSGRWDRVRAGTIDRSQVRGGIFHPEAEVVAGYPDAVNLGSSAAGRIILADQRGQNIALGLNASEVGITDGRIGTPVWSLPQGLGALNRVVDLTLPDLTRINRVRVITKPPQGNETYEGNSLLGYSVQISEDQSRWIEMGGLNDIEDFVFTEVQFNPVLARYVRVQVTQAEVGSDPAKVTEVQIYGVDFVPEGAFVSAPLDLGDPEGIKNFGRVRWWADTPPSTSVDLQFSTGDSPNTADPSWSPWSDSFEESDIFMPSPEPRRYLRYRVNLHTEDLEFSPALDSLEIDFDAADIAARGASGAVEPHEAAMGVETPFVYRLRLQLSEGDLVETVRIRLPSQPSVVNGLVLLGEQISVQEYPTSEDGIAAVGRVLHVTPGGVRDLDIRFDPPLSTADAGQIDLDVLFEAALFTDTHEFRAFLFSPGSKDPQNVSERVEDNESWRVFVSDVDVRDLLGVQAYPQVFTPNNDGINDFTVFEFTLTKVSEPRVVDVEVFELGGRRVRRLDTPTLIGGRYQNLRIKSDVARLSPGFWDGKNDHGELVDPGIYLFSVTANLDTGDETATGVVYVAY